MTASQKTEYRECFRLMDAVRGGEGGSRGRWVREEIRKGQGRGTGGVRTESRVVGEE